MTIKISKITCSRFLVPSSIDLGSFVLNPYRGCSLGCHYCYTQKNKAIMKRKEPWGTYVDIKYNALDILRKELTEKKSVGRILIGSTTEVYQPIENEYEIMRGILMLLNEYKIPCTILTRSPFIVRDIDLLKKNPSPHVYFTISPFLHRITKILEPRSASFDQRKEAIQKIAREKIIVHVYVNPILPYMLDVAFLMETFKSITPFLDFESINMKMINWDFLKRLLRSELPDIVTLIDVLSHNDREWKQYWKCVEQEIKERNTSYKYSIKTFFHPITSFFERVVYA